MEPKNTDDPYAKTLADEPLKETYVAPLAAPDRPSLDSLVVEGRRYEPTTLLGRGGMGEVRLCADKLIGREIAMKTILAHSRVAGLARFVREAKVQARLEHPSIVPVYDIGKNDDGTVWFTMKRVRGRSLEEVIQALANNDAEAKAEFSRRKLLAAFVAVCYAVAYAHEHGVVHRDLKPGNIMLGRFGEVSVLDWGIAKVSGIADEAIVPSESLADLTTGQRPTEQGTSIGTPGYMSPEQARGESDKVGPPADVYALGAILFEILALEPLHRGTSSMALVMAALREVDARPSNRGMECAPELDAICQCACRVDESQRTQSARELAEAVERYLDGDRDLERRRQLAADHTAKAVAALAGDVAEASMSARSTALLELGRAMALDPSNPPARDLMARIMITVPNEVPPEAEGELEIERARARKAAARAGGMRYLLWCVFAPLVFWMGIRDWTVSVLVLAFMAVTGGWAFWMAQRTKPGTRSMLTLLVTSSITIALTSALFGPFLMVPGLAATNAMYFAMTFDQKHRPWAMIASIAAIAVPFALEMLHVVSPTYEFSGLSSFVVKARSSWFDPVPTQFTLVLVSVAMAIIPVSMVGRMRDALTRAEQRLFLQAWQLRATLPSEAHAPLVGHGTGKQAAVRR